MWFGSAYSPSIFPGDALYIWLQITQHDDRKFGLFVDSTLWYECRTGSCWHGTRRSSSHCKLKPKELQGLNSNRQALLPGNKATKGVGASKRLGSLAGWLLHSLTSDRSSWSPPDRCARRRRAPCSRSYRRLGRSSWRRHRWLPAYRWPWATLAPPTPRASWWCRSRRRPGTARGASSRSRWTGGTRPCAPPAPPPGRRRSCRPPRPRPRRRARTPTARRTGGARPRCTPACTPPTCRSTRTGRPPPPPPPARRPAGRCHRRRGRRPPPPCCRRVHRRSCGARGTTASAAAAGARRCRSCQWSSPAAAPRRPPSPELLHWAPWAELLTVRSSSSSTCASACSLFRFLAKRPTTPWQPIYRELAGKKVT